MKYTIEIDTDKVFTDGQNNKLYRAKGFNSLVFDKCGLDKLEPVEKAWENELEKHRREAYDKGYADGKADAIYDTDMIDELKQVEYIRGYNSAINDYNGMIQWLHDCTDDFKEFMNKKYGYDIMYLTNPKLDEGVMLYDLICDHDIAEVISEFQKWQEEKKKPEEEFFKVGDEVIGSSYGKAIVTMVDDDNDSVMVVFIDGSCGEFNKETLKKTGKNFSTEVSQLLDKLRGENND